MVRIQFSEHAINDRSDRIVKIATSMGFGNIIETIESENHYGPTRHCLTDTGVIIVKPAKEEKVITMYAISEGKLKNFYAQAAKSVPLYLLKVVRSNVKRYRDLVFENA